MLTAHEQTSRRDICPYLSLQTPVLLLYTPWVALTPGPHHWMGHTRFESGLVEGEQSFMSGAGEGEVWERDP